MKALTGHEAHAAFEDASKRLNYPSGQKLYQYLAKEGKRVRYDDAVAFADRLPARQVFAETHRQRRARAARALTAPPPRGSVVARDIDDRWMADIADLSAQPSDEYKYVLCVLNVFSRRLYARALKVRDAETTTHAFEDILREAGGSPPRELDTDAGQEFAGPFREMLDEHHIWHSIKDPQSKNTLAPLDRVIGTLKRAMFRNVVHEGNPNWQERLKETVAGINDTPQRSIGNRAPEDVKDDWELQFRLRRANSEAMVHNSSVIQRRGDALAAQGAFRVPVSTRAGKHFGLRSYQPQYGDAVHAIASVNGAVVTDTAGREFKTRHVHGVPAGSANAEHTDNMRGGSALIDRKQASLVEPYRERVVEFVGEGVKTLQAVATYMKSIGMDTILHGTLTNQKAIGLMGLHVLREASVSYVSAHAMTPAEAAAALRATPGRRHRAPDLRKR